MRISKAKQEEARLLFAGRWMPVTKTLTFIEGAVDELVDIWLATRGAWVLDHTGYPLHARPVQGDLEGLLHQLEPLITVTDRKHLFIPTADPTAPGGPWTCILGNKWNGTEGGLGGDYASRGFRAVVVDSSPSNLDIATNKGAYGVHRLGVYWPDPTERHGVGGRTIGIAQFESLRRWDFVNEGDPLPFEDTTTYTAHRVPDRFTQPMLIDYAAALGLRPFDDDFYAPDHTAVMVEDTNPPAPDELGLTLAAARSGRPFEDVATPIPWPPQTTNQSRLRRLLRLPHTR